MTNINYDWVIMLERLKSYEAHPVTVRGRETYEILSYKSIIGMSKPYLTVPERNIGKRFRYAEAAWILSGDNKVDTIKKYAPKIGKFSDDGYFFKGAYGPKVIDQIPYVIGQLMDDYETRQAVMTIWNRNPTQSKDIPCTVALQFLLRGSHLHCVATMRSSDTWLGWPYDVHNFSMISSYILLLLYTIFDNKFMLGNLYLTTGSQHLYKDDMNNVNKVLSGDTIYPESPIFDPYQFKNPQELIDELWRLANE